MQVKILTVTTIMVGGILLSGCASKQPDKQEGYLKNIDYIVKAEKQKRIKEEINAKSYHFMVKPIVNSEQDDSKVIVDMGKILKVWIAPYIIKGTLISGHSTYTWVEAPKFVAGESVGKGSLSDSSLITPNGNYPIVYRPDEVYTTQAHFTNKELKKYVNKKYQVEANPEKTLKKIDKQNNKYNKLIKKYLKEKKEK
jgi:hypothetical protein